MALEYKIRRGVDQDRGLALDELEGRVNNDVSVPAPNTWDLVGGVSGLWDGTRYIFTQALVRDTPDNPP